MENKASKTPFKYKVIEAKKFRKDVKRIERSGRYDLRKLRRIIDMLAKGEPLPTLHRNHPLKEDLEGYWECHIEPDWLLIYYYREDILVLHLQRTGTHSYLFSK